MCAGRYGSTAFGLSGVLLPGGAGPDSPSVTGASPIATGEHLVAIGGRNDCHTPGWNRDPFPPAQRLTGSPIGWTGPWGTSYPTKLRLLVQKLTPDSGSSMSPPCSRGRQCRGSTCVR